MPDLPEISRAALDAANAVVWPDGDEPAPLIEDEDDLRKALAAAAPHLRAAVLDEVDDAIPRGGSTDLALWLERHGLGVGAGPAAVLASLRQDLRALAGTAEESP